MGDDEAGQQQPPPPEIIGVGGVREVRVNVIADDNDGYLSPAGNMSPSLSFRWKTKYRLWRVPEQVRAINKEEAYAPKFVSIGPYHRYAGDDVHGGGDRNRLRGEKLKKRYLHELLKDVGPSDDGILQRCTRSLLEIVDEVRWFYAEEYVRDMKDEEIVRMLLHDGCFIIKHLYNFAMGYNEEELHATRWAPAQLRIDLALLENQIPFFVLEKIFHHLTPRSLMPKIKRGVVGHDDETMRQRKRHTLLVMAMWYMLKGWFSLPEDESDKLYKLIADEEVHHLLHLLHLAHAHLVKVDDDKAVLREHSGSANERQQQGQGYIDDDDAKAKANIVSAAQLRGLGVKIKKVPTKRGGILDVRLRDGLVTPVLEVPALTVEQATVQLLQNLVAYEQQGTLGNVDEPRDYFTTYAFLMYNLVSSTDDIAVLQEQGVLLNNFGSHETIIEYFKNLCRGNQRSGTEETPIGKVLQGLRACSQNKAYRYWAEAKKYMDSPVKILALIVSTLLAISTVLQTTTAFYPK